MSDFQLGKKVPPPSPPAAKDVIERVGDVWKLNGKFQTNKPEQPQSASHDPFKHLREVLERSQKQQEDDGFPIIYWGSM